MNQLLLLLSLPILCDLAKSSSYHVRSHIQIHIRSLAKLSTKSGCEEMLTSKQPRMFNAKAIGDVFGRNRILLALDGSWGNPTAKFKNHTFQTVTEEP
ncbi:hypothetical protein CDAR_401231 [Caerostris darwini]|uniref:Secreted protein n=1 Tax=Caerostris darwini TaxID=1538125 RepID=A0AAV4V1D9_9ARAC|nr:hypothetical protein CDAR_401231 [Caerostris darwini]